MRRLAPSVAATQDRLLEFNPATMTITGCRCPVCWRWKVEPGQVVFWRWKAGDEVAARRTFSRKPARITVRGFAARS